MQIRTANLTGMVLVAMIFIIISGSEVLPQTLTGSLVTAFRYNSLPRNIVLPKNLQPVFLNIYHRSETFRRQCRRIGSFQNLSISITLVPTIQNGYRAISTVRRTPEGRIIINLKTTLQSDYTEILAHEFEHALEQADGWNLKKLAAARVGYVYRQDDGTFETERAIQAGRQVALEFRTVTESKLVQFASLNW